MTMTENMWLSLIHMWLTIASTSYKNCLQYTVVPLTELINENSLSLTTNLSTV